MNGKTTIKIVDVALFMGHLLFWHLRTPAFCPQSIFVHLACCLLKDVGLYSRDAMCYELNIPVLLQGTLEMNLKALGQVFLLVVLFFPCQYHSTSDSCPFSECFSYLKDRPAKPGRVQTKVWYFLSGEAFGIKVLSLGLKGIQWLCSLSHTKYRNIHTYHKWM
jgi:hypothetical protein